MLVYLIINELFRSQFDKLIELVRAQAFSINANIDYSAWRNLREKLFFDTYGSLDWKSCIQDFHPKLLGRVKLLWNYLRSSFEDRLFMNQLRSKSLVEFFEGLEKLLADSSEIELKHDPERDWVYTSDKKDPGPYELT